MPYRKTRRISKSKKRQTRHQRQNQRGGVGGILSLFKRKPEALPIPFESYKSSINRLFLFLYKKLNPQTPGYIPLAPSQTVLTLEQKEFFRSLLLPYVSRNAETGRKVYRQEEFVREVLGAESLNTLNEELVAVESVGKPVRDIIYNRNAKGESFAGSFDRLVPILLASEKVIQYRQNWERNICTINHTVDQNRPIQGLYENRCIFILHNKDDFEVILMELQMVYGDSFTIGPGLPYILVEKQYLPQMDEKVFPYTRIKSAHLMDTTFITDAFSEDGVVEIQSDLARVIAEDEPAFWKNLPLVQIRKLSQLEGLNLYKDKYLIVDDSSSLTNGQYISLTRVPTNTRVYGFDQQTSILLRTNYSELWSRWINDPNFTFFAFLSPQEQSAIAKIQFAAFVKELRKNPTTALQVYSISLETKEVQDKFLRDFSIDNIWKYERIFSKYI